MDIITNTKTMRSTKNFGEKIQLLETNKDAIYPGAIVAVSNSRGVQLKPLDDRNLPRSPINLSLLGTNNTEFVQKPTVSSINQATTTLLQKNDWSKTTGSISYSYAEVHDFNQAMQELNLNANWLFASLEAKYKSAKQSKKNVLWVRFQQVYYSITADGYNEPAAFFLHDSADGNAVNGFIKNISLGNPPCYVAQIDYGRTFLVQMTSSLSIDSIKASFDAGYKVFLKGDGQVEAITNSQDIEVEVLAQGGNPTEWQDFPIHTDFTEMLRKIASVIKQGLNPESNPATPVSMTLRHLSDRSAVCISSTIEYKIKDERVDFVPGIYVLDSIEVHVSSKNKNGNNWDPLPGFEKPDINASFEGQKSNNELSDRYRGWLQFNQIIDLTRGSEKIIKFFDNDIILDPTGDDEIGFIAVRPEDLLVANNGKPANILKPVEIIQKYGQLYRVALVLRPRVLK